MSRTIAYALEYVLHTLEFSPDDCTVPVSEKELKDQPTADPNVRDIFATIVWNDEKHSFDEVTRHLCDTVGRSNENATAIVDAIDDISSLVECNRILLKSIEYSAGDIVISRVHSYQSKNIQMGKVKIIISVKDTDCYVIIENMEVQYDAHLRIFSMTE